MTTGQDLVVRRDDIAVWEVRDALIAPLEAGEARLRIEAFAVTANNVTYAAIGEAMHYWAFFPGSEGWGRVPVWGHATVEDSRADGIAAGERVYGYLPMSTHLVVRPGSVSGQAFADTTDYRQPMAAIYNRYRRLGGDPGHDAARENERMVFEPLFTTSWLIQEMFARDQWHGAEALVMTSASSKTALALAHVARTNAPGVARVGLTSPGNVAFVEGTGLYDRVLSYDAIPEIAGTRSVSVDFAGNGQVLRHVHEALGDDLAYSCLVGLTHWDTRSGAGAEMPGPKPVLFFAPTHAAETIREMGAEQFVRAVGASWRKFVGDADTLVKIEPRDGLAAAGDAFADLVAGTARADVATVVRV